jgi:2-(1,2-epoxy-1,2-dihydrophenyl)acetyl-CoA isomerase
LRMPYEQIAAERDGSVEWITLKRPDRLNALTATMSHELEAAFGDAAAEGSVRCIVLTGAGRGFCAGQDLTEFEAAYRSEGRPDIAEHLRSSYHRLIPLIVDTPKPVIAAVNGVAAGAGLSLALACDLRFASDAAKFTQAFVKIGLIPDSGGTYLLPRAVGYAKALELSITGDLIDAEAALRAGLVNRVVPEASFRDEVAGLAGRLASMPTMAIAATKSLLRGALHLTLGEALEREAAAQSEMGQTHDHVEGVNAFVEKRDPKFEGR